jgi:HK97 family phage portal protein
MPWRRYKVAYKEVEVVNRGVNLIVDAASAINIDVGDKLPFAGQSLLRKNKVHQLLNHQPNPFQDISAFKRNIYLDFVTEGNIFLYFDGVHIYHLPAQNVEIVTDKKTYISHYSYERKNFKPAEIIHIKENSANSIFRGDSRLSSASRSLETLSKMQDFQDNFFTNGAVPGLIIKSPNTLSAKVKERLLESWRRKYNPRTGGKRPLILDGGLELDSINQNTFRELDFEDAVKAHETRILKALGVPPILLDAGNNANINPNLRLFYLNTVVPIVRKLVSGLERFFSYDLEIIVQNVEALRPELKDEADYYSALVNNGIMTGAEARKKLRLEDLDDPELTSVRIPANVSGSATGVTGQEGGAPKKPKPSSEE